MTFDSTFKGAVTIDYAQAAYYNKIHHKNDTFKICKEQMFSGQVVFYFQKDFYLVQEFNDKIKYLKAAGILDIWLKKYIDNKYLLFKQPKIRAGKLKFRNLQGGFEIFCAGVLISILVFSMEVVSRFQMMRILRRIFE